MIACVRNDIIIEPPQAAPMTWVDPDPNGLSYSGFNNLSLEDMFLLGWKVVVDEPVEYNELFETVTVGPWYYDSTSDEVTRDYTVNLVDFPTALTNCFNVIDANREKYEVGGQTWTYFGIPVKIMTDKESSQGKILSTLNAVEKNWRQNQDVFKLIKVDDGSTLVVQLTNEEVEEIAQLVFRNLQDAYNLLSYYCYQMLGTGSTENLKIAVESETIPLNPWNV